MRYILRQEVERDERDRQLPEERQLEQMLQNVSRAYEADVETRVTTLTSLLEPLIIVVMGGMVAFIAMAILMPLVQMNQLVQ